MSLNLFTSTGIEDFNDKVKEFYIGNTSVFQPLYVVVENSATIDYLKFSLAKQIGIVANIQFKKTNELLELIAQTLSVNVNKSEILKPGQLNWLIYEVFDSAEFRHKFKEIAEYFGNNELKRFTLSEKVSSLFDRYQNLEPQIIKNWNNQKYDPDRPNEAWQCYLWREIVKISGNKVLDKTKVIEDILIALKEADKIVTLKNKIPKLAFYGQVEYSSDLLSLLQELSQHIDVFVYHPDAAVKLSSLSENRLLKNFGAFLSKQKKLLNESKFRFEKMELSNRKYNPKTLLGSLQNTILTGDTHDNKLIADDSITISNCFSRNREVEVLYNYILNQFEKDKSLGTRDICVFAPDINEYSSAIKAIFNNNKYEVKYSFYDSSFNIEESPYAALLALFDIDENNLSSESVLGLLDFKYIREKFGFSEDAGDIRRAVNSANIRHGLDGNKEIETNYVSWRYGLNRLIYGFCLSKTESLVTIDGEEFYPVGEYEGNEVLDLIRLNCLVEGLASYINERNRIRTLADWMIFLEKQIDLFLNTNEYSLTYFYSLVKGNDIKFDFIEKSLVPFSVFKHYVTNILNEMEVGSKSGFQGVRFTSLQPFTCAPAKIYAFLGMNSSDFPRNNTRLSFDLTDEGTRSTGDLDKHLFLNCLLSAESKFYISYVGQSVKDNSSIPPSAVVDELLSAIEPILIVKKEAPKEIEKLIIKHPLHGFSYRYNSKNESELIRYATKTEGKNINIKTKGDQQKNNTFSNEINLNDFIRFLTDPFKWYYNKTLKIYYEEEEVILAESELFELDPLQNWEIKDELFRLNKYTPDELEKLRLEKVRKGFLPLCNTGLKLLTDINNEIEALRDLVEPFISGHQKRSININVDVGKYRLKGDIDNIFDDSLVFATVSSDKYKYKLNAFIQYLAIVASKKVQSTQLYYFHKESECDINIKGISYDTAINILNTWCGYFEMGQSRIFSFTTDIGLSSKKVKSIKENNPGEKDLINALNAEISKLRHPFKNNCYFSEYLKKEFDTGYFTVPDNITEFLNAHDQIIGKLDFYFTKQKA